MKVKRVFWVRLNCAQKYLSLQKCKTLIFLNKSLLVKQGLGRYDWNQFIRIRVIKSLNLPIAMLELTDHLPQELPNKRFLAVIHSSFSWFHFWAGRVTWSLRRSADQVHRRVPPPLALCYPMLSHSPVVCQQ